jgi:hypothetical protein
MKNGTLFLLALVCTCCIAVRAQTVAITPKKEVYRRPKPIQPFKRTFTVRRPIVKASSPSISKKITAAISPESVLDLNLKDEMREYQWLEEADYKVIYNQKGILTVNSWMEGSAAYPDSVSKYVVVDTSTGRRVTPQEVFVNTSGLAAAIKKIQAAEIKSSTEEMKQDPENRDVDVSELFASTDFTVEDLKEFSIDARGITFHYNYGFPHVLKAVEPDGEYFLTWAQLKPFIRKDGLLARFVR